MAHKKFFLNDEAIKAVRDNVDLYAEVFKGIGRSTWLFCLLSLEMVIHV
jgi:hypothetical protein